MPSRLAISLTVCSPSSISITIFALYSGVYVFLFAIIVSSCFFLLLYHCHDVLAILCSVSRVHYNIFCCPDIILLDQLCDDILLPLAHWFSFSSCHKKSASCVISILPQLTDFLQTFFQRVTLKNT